MSKTGCVSLGLFEMLTFRAARNVEDHPQACGPQGAGHHWWCLAKAPICHSGSPQKHSRVYNQTLSGLAFRGPSWEQPGQVRVFLDQHLGLCNISPFGSMCSLPSPKKFFFFGCSHFNTKNRVVWHVLVLDVFETFWNSLNGSWTASFAHGKGVRLWRFAGSGYGKYFKVGLVEDLDYKDSCEKKCSINMCMHICSFFTA